MKQPPASITASAARWPHAIDQWRMADEFDPVAVWIAQEGSVALPKTEMVPPRASTATLPRRDFTNEKGAYREPPLLDRAGA
jgi:hypothetical protein